MPYKYYVNGLEQKRVPILIRPATDQDLIQTVTHHWDSDWTSPEMSKPTYHLFAFIDSSSDTLIALCTYEDKPNGHCVKLIYGESEPKSHPRLVAKRESRRYTGIGKVLIAFGVQLSLDNGYDGTIYFKAKTTELYEHYRRTYRAKDIFSEHYALIIYDLDAIEILNEFKEAKHD